MSTRIRHIKQKLGNKFHQPGTLFSFTGSGLSTWIWHIIQKWESDFQRPGTQFSFNGSMLSSLIWHIIQNLGSNFQIPVTRWRLLDLGCLPGSDFTEFRRTISSGYYLLVGARFPFTGSGLSTQIRRIILKLGNNFRGPGVQFSFTGSGLSTWIRCIIQKLGQQFQETGSKVLDYWTRVVFPDPAYFAGPGLSYPDPSCIPKLGKQFLGTEAQFSFTGPGSVPGSSILYRNLEKSVQIGNTVLIYWI